MMAARAHRSWKDHKGSALAVVGAMYLIAIGMGILSYILCPLPWGFLLKVAVGDTVMTIVIFLFSLITDNPSCYDPYWSFIPMVFALLYPFYRGWSMWMIPFVAAFAFWGLRLTLNWIKSFDSFHYIDWRYRMLHEKSGRGWLFINFFGIHFFPSAVVWAAGAPFLFLLSRGNWPFSWLSLIGLGLSLGATLLQLVSDRQMALFKADPKHRGQAIDIGLWRYSRHPNYLGECLMWLGVYLMALPYLWGAGTAWALLFAAGPLLMFALFLGISIPMMEQHNATKAGYAEYRRQTSAFLLLPRRKK